jgi:hypothetical protein
MLDDDQSNGKRSRPQANRADHFYRALAMQKSDRPKQDHRQQERGIEQGSSARRIPPSVRAQFAAKPKVGAMPSV